MNYNRFNPFFAPIVERYPLSKQSADKKTFHIALDIAGSNIDYRPGDSIGVLPKNNDDVVEELLVALKATGGEEVIHEKTEQKSSLHTFLTYKSNISSLNRKLIKEISERQSNEKKKEALQTLLNSSDKYFLREYMETHYVADILNANEEVTIDPTTLCNLLQSLLPRFYSIASSRKAVGEAIHLTVALLEYEVQNTTRRGICTEFLCSESLPMGESIPIYLQPTKEFLLPNDPTAPVIMVGPGTGVAPFRAFMQDRVAAETSGKNWLFFGERHRLYNYFYEELWQRLVMEGNLRIDTAFSRDQPEKIYVHHRMLEHAHELYHWLEQGAYFYVCGDAHRMAKDVDATLHTIIRQQGGHTEEAAVAYVKQMRKEKRYLRDVY